MRVLLADDQVWLRSALRLLLEAEAHLTIVGETSTLASLPALVAELNPDVLLLDWQLSGLNTNGARLCVIGSMRAKKPDLIIVALTDDFNAGGCLRLGVNAQINCARPPDNILATVQLAAAQRAMLRPPQSDDYHLH